MGNIISKEGFSPVTLEDKQLFEDILNSCELYQDLAASEFSFQSFYCWGAYDNPLKCVIDEGIVVFYEHSFGNDNVFYAPIVKKPEYLVPVMMKIVTFCRKNGIKVHMERLTNNMAELARKHIDCRQCEVLESRRDFEYLYDPTELIKLEGKKFKNKRNFVNGFKERYNYEFLPYDKSMREELLALVRAWGSTHDELDAQNEYKAIERSIDNVENLDLFCDVIKVDGKIIAFEIGFINPGNVGVVLFEKANIDYRGSYQAICNFFTEKHFANCKYVNRQEDLGIPGLRKAKMSYNPVGFAEKFIYTDKKDVIDEAHHLEEQENEEQS
ncbi:MAG: DUF2156 domain-containing protein [Clostridia bacterium]|nr:DUF2156 domain-containing protein [Clostridia bacterium]